MLSLIYIDGKSFEVELHKLIKNQKSSALLKHTSKHLYLLSILAVVVSFSCELWVKNIWKVEGEIRKSHTRGMTSNDRYGPGASCCGLVHAPSEFRGADQRERESPHFKLGSIKSVACRMSSKRATGRTALQQERERGNGFSGAAPSSSSRLVHPHLFILLGSKWDAR